MDLQLSYSYLDLVGIIIIYMTQQKVIQNYQNDYPG